MDTYHVVDMERQSSATERFANVIYWCSCAIAMFWTCLGIAATSSIKGHLQWDHYLAIILPAILAFAIGRAARYILAARCHFLVSS